jgi:hypothetical protein
LFSGHATSQDLAPAREAGYDFTLLSKPVHPEIILKHVSQNLHKTRRATSPAHFSPVILPPSAFTERA